MLCEKLIRTLDPFTQKVQLKYESDKLASTECGLMARRRLNVSREEE
jgi:hypothetical protein